jgi:hypothetical protein
VAPAQQRGNDDVENIERSDGERNPVGVGGVGGIQNPGRWWTYTH